MDSLLMVHSKWSLSYLVGSLLEPTFNRMFLMMLLISLCPSSFFTDDFVWC